MSATLREAYTAKWTKVFKSEITRRKDLYNSSPASAKEMFSSNPRGLVEDCGAEHVWIPATTVWIHDEARGGYKIDGVKRRGLTEAFPYVDKASKIRVLPQVCNNCSATREREVPVISAEDRAALEKERKAADRKLRRQLKRKAVEPDTSVTLEDFGL